MVSVMLKIFKKPVNLQKAMFQMAMIVMTHVLIYIHRLMRFAMDLIMIVMI